MLWLLLAACSPGGGLPNAIVASGQSAVAISHRGDVVTHTNRPATGERDAQLQVFVGPATGGLVLTTTVLTGGSERDLRFDHSGRVMVAANRQLTIVHPSGVVWAQVPLPGEVRAAPASVDDGWIVGHDGGITRVSASEELLWTAELQGTVRGHLVIGSDGSAYAIVDDAGAFSAARVSAEGKLMWQAALPTVTTTPALAKDDTLLVTVQTGSLLDAASGEGQELHALDPGSGDTVFTASIGAQPMPPLVSPDGDVLVLGNISAEVSQLFVCDAQSGRVSARARFDGLTTGGALDDQGRLWHGCREGVCVRNQSGRLLGSYESYAPVSQAPALYDGLMVANMSGDIQTWWLGDATTAANDGWSRVGGDGPGTGQGWGR